MVIYRSHALTYAAGRVLIRGVRHLALPNLLTGSERVPEFIQDLRVGPIVELLASERVHEAEALARDLHALLGPGDGVLAVADEARRLVSPRA